MSLEDKIDALIHALDRNTNTILGQKGGAPSAPTTPAKAATPPADLASKAGQPPKAATKPAPASTKPASVAKKVETPAPAASAFTYEQVSKATIALHQAKGRDTVVGILTKFGAKAAKELKPEQYDAYMADIEAAGGETELA